MKFGSAMSYKVKPISAEASECHCLTSHDWVSVAASVNDKSMTIKIIKLDIPNSVHNRR
jgi:hypothetical protein